MIIGITELSLLVTTVTIIPSGFGCYYCYGYCCYYDYEGCSGVGVWILEPPSRNLIKPEDSEASLLLRGFSVYSGLGVCGFR